jgi:hypothetical protein
MYIVQVVEINSYSYYSYSYLISLSHFNLTFLDLQS